MRFHGRGQSRGNLPGCDPPAAPGRHRLTLPGLGRRGPVLRRPGGGPAEGRQRLSARLAADGALLLTFAMAAAALAAGQTVAASRPEGSTAQTPSDHCQTRPVAFRAGDRSLLHGYSCGAGRRWVILVHDRGQNARAWRTLAPALRANGFRVLTFDASRVDASPDSQAHTPTPGDVLAALDFARAQGASSRYLIGAESGATAALVAAGTSAVKALVLLSPQAQLAGVPRDAIRLTAAPKLLFIGSLDERAAREGRDVFERSIGWTVLTWIPVRSQGIGLLATRWRKQILETISLFLRDYP
jgi:hypothetical protein